MCIVYCVLGCTQSAQPIHEYTMHSAAAQGHPKGSTQQKCASFNTHSALNTQAPQYTVQTVWPMSAVLVSSILSCQCLEPACVLTAEHVCAVFAGLICVAVVPAFALCVPCALSPSGHYHCPLSLVCVLLICWIGLSCWLVFCWVSHLLRLLYFVLFSMVVIRLAAFPPGAPAFLY